MASSAFDMNLLLTIIGSSGLWSLFDFYKQNPQSAVIGTVILMFAGVVAVFAFRFLFDLLLPDPPARPDSRYAALTDGDGDW